MSASLINEKDGEGASVTLGDLLYADQTRPRVLEREWLALVESIAKADQSALRVLYERSHGLVFTLALRITGNRQHAEEVVLDVYHHIWLRAETYDAGTETVLAWIMNQARSRSIDRVRLERRKKRVATGEGGTLIEQTDHDGFDRTESHKRSSQLQSALTALTDKERLAIEKAFFSELTCAEVAVESREPVGTITARIRSGLMKLRRAHEGVSER